MDSLEKHHCLQGSRKIPKNVLLHCRTVKGVDEIRMPHPVEKARSRILVSFMRADGLAGGRSDATEESETHSFENPAPSSIFDSSHVRLVIRRSDIHSSINFMSAVYEPVDSLIHSYCEGYKSLPSNECRDTFSLRLLVSSMDQSIRGMRHDSDATSSRTPVL